MRNKSDLNQQTRHHIFRSSRGDPGLFKSLFLSCSISSRARRWSTELVHHDLSFQNNVYTFYLLLSYRNCVHVQMFFHWIPGDNERGVELYGGMVTRQNNADYSCGASFPAPQATTTLSKRRLQFKLFSVQSVSQTDSRVCCRIVMVGIINCFYHWCVTSVNVMIKWVLRFYLHEENRNEIFR